MHRGVEGDLPGQVASLQFSSVAQSCLTLCDPMDCRTPGLPVYHQLSELAQTHVHQVGDAIQLSHPLSSPFADLDLCIRGPHTQPLSPSCFMTWPQNCSDPATGVLGVGLDGAPHLLAPLPASGLWDMYASLSWGPRIPTLSLASSCMSCLQWGPGLREPPVSSLENHKVTQ